MLSTMKSCNVPSREHYVAFARNSITVTRSASKPVAVNSINSSAPPSQGSWSTLSSPVIPTTAQLHGSGLASVW